MKFLSDQCILEQVRSLVGQDGDILAAVAFWGSGAVEQTGIARKKSGCARVLCDLFSGACNPGEIRELLKLPNVKVRTHYGMHAKVWANGDHVIVGSANASMNGLGFAAGVFNVEAAVQLRNPTIAKQVREWFKEKWRDASEIDEQVLTEAENVWLGRQNNSPRPIMNYRIGAYLAEALDCDLMRWWEENNPDFDANQDQAEYPLYVFEPAATVPQPGTVILDFACQENNGRFAFNGAWRIDGQPELLPDNRQVVVWTEVNAPRFPNGHDGVAQMVRCWVEDNASALDDNGWYVYMNFADFFYGMRSRCQGHEDRCNECPFPQEGEV